MRGESMSDDSRLIEENPFSDEHLYRLIYSVKVQDPRLTKDEVPPGYGATDALLGVSVLYPEDGSLSVLFFFLHGRHAGGSLARGGGGGGSGGKGVVQPRGAPPRARAPPPPRRPSSEKKRTLSEPSSG